MNATTREYFILKVFKGADFAGYFVRDGRAWRVAKIAPTAMRKRAELSEKELKAGKAAFLKMTKNEPKKKVSIQASRVTEKVDAEVIWTK